MSIRVRKVNNFTNSLTTVSALVLAEDALRKHATLVNASDVGIWLAFGEAAVVGTGVFLAAAGGSYEIDGNNLFTGEIYAIAASGAGKVLAGAEFS